jgi:large subunit ribosomal protein L1
MDNTGNIHFKIGKCSSDLNKLKENLKIVIDSILKNRSFSTKKAFINSFYMCTTMGPSIKINISTLNDFLKT